jgi:hypothetical protein
VYVRLVHDNMASAMDYCNLRILHKRSLCQWMLQILWFLFIAPGGAVSQFPPPEGMIVVSEILFLLYKKDRFTKLHIS